MNVFITGGTRGIGRSLVENFCKKNHTVFFCYKESGKNALEIENDMKSKGYYAKGIQADISITAEVLKAVSEINSICGGIDILINNAGISLTKMFSDVTDEEWEALFAVNVKGTYSCIKAVLPYMISKKKGKIINISSVWGITGASCEAAYSASKAAVIGLTKALAKELGPSNITVNCIAPGVIDTCMNKHLSKDDISSLIDETPLMRIGTGNDVSTLALFLAGDESGFITGQVISVDGGFAI